jgi:hypothetical protein
LELEMLQQLEGANIEQDGSVDLFGQESTALSIATPLDGLFAEYRKKKADIERIAGYVSGETDVMGYFISGALLEHRYSHISATSLFEIAPAIRALDAEFWSRAMSLTDVLECMPAARRAEWSSQIQKHETPPFEVESVRATLMELLSMRTKFFSERVDGLFRALSGEHVTNQPQGFSKRMIVGWMLSSYGSVNSDRVNYVHDLRCIIAKFMGRNPPRSNITYNSVDEIHRAERYGQWHSFDGGAFKLKIFRKGTAHFEVHPDIAWRLNQVLAFLYPMAIPDQFRKKPAKRAKEHSLFSNLIPFEVIEELYRANLNRAGNALTFSGQPREATVMVLNYLGGVPSSNQYWEFDYNIKPVLDELQRTGQVPDHKTHQYYPTKETLARMAVDLADIQSEHSVVEPSAGQGGIADFLPVSQTLCVEVSRLHCAVLTSKGFNTVCADFLAWNPGRKFDRCVMNPPFSNGRAVEHVRHAASMMSSDGRLVAIMPASYKGKTVVDGWAHEWSQVYADEFNGTGVSVAILVLMRQ